MSNERVADILVVGSGSAGLFFALRAERFARVAIITKKDRPESSTNYAQGGIAAVFDPDDSHRLHAADTFVAGAGLCHADAVNVLVSEGPARIRELIEFGVNFSQEGGRLSLGREGGHSRRRIVRAQGRRVLSLNTTGVQKELLTPAANGALEIYLVTIAPGGSSGPELYTHKGEEGGYVMSGEMLLEIESETFYLKTGDSFRFKSQAPHRFANTTEEETVVVWTNVVG